jgi:hypothetical protein
MVIAMVLNTTFNNISVILWWSVLMVEETRVHEFTSEFFLLKIIVLYCGKIGSAQICLWGRRGRDCMVVGFTTTYAISVFIS